MKFIDGDLIPCKPSDFNVPNAALIAKHYLCPDEKAKTSLQISSKLGAMHNSLFAISRCDVGKDANCEKDDAKYNKYVRNRVLKPYVMQN